MNENESTIRDPYRILFPIGIAGGILGVSLWVLFSYRVISFYPRAAHANLMYFGLLWSFIAGFLMTAIPRMTKTTLAHYSEVFFAVFLALMQAILNVRNQVEMSVYLFLPQTLLLIFFVSRRFFIFRRIPFPGFIFMPLAFGQALLGVALFAMGDGLNREAVLILSGEAFIMNLVMGLGGRLIPAISRLTAAVLPGESLSNEDWIWPILAAVALNFGYGFQVWGAPEVGHALKLVGLTIGSFKLLRLADRPASWTVAGAGLKVCVLSLVAGPILAMFDVGLAGQHLTLIGGFALVTLLVSTRVVLAHGTGGSLDYEVFSGWFVAMILLIVGAAVLRWLAGANPVGGMILLSSGFFILGLSLWLRKFVTS